MDTSQSPEMGGVPDTEDISVGSLVQVIVGKKISYGIVRWIGYLPDHPEKSALLEVVGYNILNKLYQLASLRNSCSSERKEN